MSWNKPKKVIINIFVYLGKVFGTISFIALITIFAWIEYPKGIAIFDKAIPDFHEKSMKVIYKAANNVSNKTIKLIIFKKIYEDTKDLTPLERFYDYKKKSNEYLINYYLENNDSLEAIEIAEYWKKNNPYDFDAKFAYINALDTKDKNKALKYFEDLYTKYNNIQRVTEESIKYLIKNNQINNAVKVQDKFNDTYSQSKITFMLFYIADKKINFNAKQIISLKHHKEKINNKTIYTIELDKEFKSLKGLRLDIDSALTGAKVSNLKVSIEKDKVIYKNLKVVPMHSVNKFKNNSFVISGDDPHVKMELPKEIKNESGKFKVYISLEIVDEMHYVEEKFLNNPEWRILYDTGNSFNESEFHNISLTREDIEYSYKSNVSWANVQSVRLDLLSLIGLRMKDLSITINDKTKLDSTKVIDMHGLVLQNGEFIVSKEDPYLIIKLKEITDISSIKINMKF